MYVWILNVTVQFVGGGENRIFKSTMRSAFVLTSNRTDRDADY